jgi:RNA-binding protein YlmH
MMKEEELLRKRLRELADKAYAQNIYTHTHFLNEYEQSIYQEMRKELAFIDSRLEGGHEYFTRAAVIFGSENMFGYEGEIPLACARISPLFDKFAEDLTHRDFLGALMHLGIERHQIGDILVEGKEAFVFCFPHIGELLKDELSGVRHTMVSVELVSPDEIVYTQKFQKKEGFISSMRLDAVVALSYGISRKMSDNLLKAQKIFLNGRLETRGDQRIKPGDILSVRGYGKFRVKELGKQSKKGRQFIVLDLFM